MAAQSVIEIHALPRAGWLAESDAASAAARRPPAARRLKRASSGGARLGAMLGASAMGARRTRAGFPSMHMAMRDP